MSSSLAFVASSTTAWSRTIIGPLTTTFTPPAACNTGLLDCAACVGGTRADYEPAKGQQCVASVNDPNLIQDATTCWPKASEGAPEPSLPLNGWGFYSPGLHCPAGYQTACSAIAGGSSDWNSQYILTQGETAVGCCPSGFQCARDSHSQYCSSTATAGAQFPLYECFWFRDGYASFELPATFTPTSADPTTTITQSAYLLQAPMVQIVWQESDRPTSKTNSPSTAAHSTNSRAKPSSGTTNSSPETVSPHHDNGLSTGAKASIGVIVPIAVIAAFVAILYYLKLRARRAANYQYYTRESEQARTDHLPEKHPQQEQLLELDGVVHGQPQELESPRYDP